VQRRKIRTALLLVFLASPVLAQGSAATTAALSACGPAHIEFDVKQGQAEHPPEPESGQALFYVRIWGRGGSNAS
jgi:hypothetical protein